ncbi:MAG: response regulator transcription factor [Clostridiales Family XIII bacterium]|jgi:DNA-binding response OmpR family regulator|nr:response regulator transcription factor [Clostridiales Family XIII bacterium]
MSEKILIVEDDEKLARMIELELGHEDYETEKAFDGAAGLEKAEGADFDLILLDVMLPGISGIEVLRRLRKSKATPVILLTARDETVDKVLGLDSGADDYVTKPFVIEELLARIRAAIRKRAGGTGGGAVDSHALTAGVGEGTVRLDADAHTTTCGGEEVELTHKEFELLHCLLENKGRVMSRDALLNHVWGYDFIGETNVVDVYIRFLRSKIDERFDIKLITTVRGVGYKIV